MNHELWACWRSDTTFCGLQGLLVLYPFLWWPLYSLLISQRRKKLKTV